ncbi:MAG: LytTR family DNA-binding domain-containing protein [Bacteroidota bacterium]
MSFSGVLIVADDQPMSEYLVKDLTQLGHCIKGIFSKGEETLAFIKQHPIDLIFMSNSLGGQLNGIETVKIINKFSSVPIVYLIRQIEPEIITQIHQTRHQLFLTYPYSPSTLKATLAYVAADPSKFDTEDLISPAKKQDRLFLRKKDSYVKVNIADILWIKGAGACIEIMTLKEGKIVLSLNLRQFSLRCPHPELMRVHKSYIVNLGNVKEVVGRQLLLGERLIPFTEYFVPDISDILPIVRR